MTAHEILFIAVAFAALTFTVYAAYRWLWTWALVAARLCFAVWVGVGVLLLSWEFAEPILRHMLDTGQIALPFLTEVTQI